ncbi:cysteine desulfurase family protein [candidate division KSB1 bacterium]
MKKVYLDNSASTPIDKRVLEKMIPFFREKYGNPTSIHFFGREAKDAVEHAREQIAHVIKAGPQEIYFTSGGTESDNWALTGYCLANKNKGNHIVTCEAEHPAVINTCKYLEKFGFLTTYIPIEKDGTLSIKKIDDAVKPETILLSFMHVNNEIGTINEIQEIGDLAKNKGIIFHSDCVQSFGKVPINVKKTNIDLISLSSHKIYGPKGMGALFVKKGTKIDKIIHGGGNEMEMRAGTENVASIVGFGEAAYISGKNLDKESRSLTELRNYFHSRLKEEIEDIRINGGLENRLPGNLNVSFANADGESILLSLDLHGIAASAGSACHSGSVEISPIIKALDPPHEFTQSALRFSLGRWTTRSDIDYTVKTLKDVVSRVRNLDNI